MRRFGALLLGAMAAGAAAPASAGPDCAAGVRAQVRRGIFDERFAANLGATALPFAIFFGVAAVVHAGVPGLAAGRRGPR